MKRIEKFYDYIVKIYYVNVCIYGNNSPYDLTNIPPILKNLDKAMCYDALYDFLMNAPPYRCAFPYSYTTDNHEDAMGAYRNKDQIALVFALNIYGSMYPSFAIDLNAMLKKLAQGNSKEYKAAIVLIEDQLHLQEQEISLINFVDEELIRLLNSATGKHKATELLLWWGTTALLTNLLFYVLFPLLDETAVLITYLLLGALCIGGIISTAFWVSLPTFNDEVIAKASRIRGICVDSSLGREYATKAFSLATNYCPPDIPLPSSPVSSEGCNSSSYESENVTETPSINTPIRENETSLPHINIPDVKPFSESGPTVPYLPKKY
ncbi:MAG: hypothetical protein IKB73_03745 [Ruminococcus sp.]|nr:hypothetical protein [Ruminococcus sp.]